jgi:uncharacterized membrane protein (DUF4010 family)
MELQELIPRLALALGIGLLIGLERGWRRRDASPGSRAAGIRTFALSGLLGGVIAMLAQALGGAATAGGGSVLAVGLAAYAAVIAIFTRDENKAAGSFSATNAIAGLLTFALGAYALIGDMRIAAATAVAATGLLAAREELHGWLQKITWPELRSGVVLLAMTFIGLPIMPDDPVGPLGGVNPSEIWLIAIVLAGVSFFGYAAVKYLGARSGLLVAAAAGGLVSSTAVTIANARQAAAGDSAPHLLAAGVAVASAIMFARVAAIVIVLKPSLIVLSGPPLLAATAVAAGFAVAWIFRKGTDTREPPGVQLRNPFEFWSVAGFALFLGTIVVLGRAVGERFGATAATVGAIFVGFADIDAIVVSMAQLAPDTLSAPHAAVAILAAVASNTVSKIVIGAAIGRGRFAAEIAGMAFCCLLSGAVALWLTHVLTA